MTQAFVAAEELKKQNISVTVINARFVKPLDTEMLDCLQEENIITSRLSENSSEVRFLALNLSITTTFLSSKLLSS